MSVILECQPGDVAYCLQRFSASPDGEPFSWDTAREFRPGEAVRFVSFRQDARQRSRPNSWYVIFDAEDGRRYAATQTYLVTAECWKGLKSHFTRRRPAGRHTTKKAMPQESAPQTKRPSTRKRRSA